MRGIIKLALLAAVAVFVLWGARYSYEYLPWKHSVVRFTPGVVKSVWTSKVFERLVRNDLTRGEWQELTVPEPNGKVSDWLKENAEATGVKHIATRFESPAEYENFRKACAGMVMEYFAGAEEEGRVEVYILGLDRGRRTLYYRTKEPIVFTTDDTTMLDKIEDYREKYNETRRGKNEYQLFKF